MYSECDNCFGTGMVFADALSHNIDLDLVPCPVCDGEGAIPDDQDDDDDDDGEQEGDDDAE